MTLILGLERVGRSKNAHFSKKKIPALDPPKFPYIVTQEVLVGKTLELQNDERSGEILKK